jgi:Tol biopolymer transport system component
MKKQRLLQVVFSLVFCAGLLIAPSQCTNWVQDFGSPGATLAVSSVMGTGVTESDINAAIDKGLAYLAKTMVHPDGVTGYWETGDINQRIASTAMAITAFELQGYLPNGGNKPEYNQVVQLGLNYLLQTLKKETISPQPAGKPDSNGNGYGLYPVLNDQEVYMYTTGIVLMAIAVSGAPDEVAEVGDEGVKGRKLKDIAQDITDYLAWAQSDAPYDGRGGWRYYANDTSSDMSVSQWPVIGMEAAEEIMGIRVPGWVKSELSVFLAKMQDKDGGFGYSSSATDQKNVAKTAAGIISLLWVGVKPKDNRIILAQKYIADNWETANDGWNHAANFGNYYAMYGVAKSSRLAGDIKNLGIHDWYSEYAEYLVRNQGVDGSWNDQAWAAGNYTISSAWALLILLRTVFATPIPTVSVPSPTPTPINLTPVPCGQISMTVRADPEEAVVSDTILVEVKLTGDSAKCGQNLGLGKDLVLTIDVDIYKFQIIPTSLNPAGEVAGNRITWRQGVLENGETTFTFQVQGRVEGKYKVADSIRATLFECENNYCFVEIEDSPVVTILPTQPRVCESACSWWQLFPWWWLAPILLLFLLALLLWLTPLGKNLWKKPWVCKLLAALTLLYSLFLITLIARSLIGNLCNADNIYFWKINQAGDVGIYVTRFGEQSASPVQSMNRGSECVACHAVSGSKENPILTAVRDEQNGLILMQSLTGEEVPIPPVNGSYLAWSPDGKQAAISMNDKDIQILDLKTGTLTPLAGASEANVVETMPAWSPDGTTIAFVRAVRTSPDTARIDVPADIYTVPASGGTALPLPGASGEGFNYYPVYSPDGKWLAFTHHTTGKDTYADDAADLYLVPAGGGQRILLRANRTDFADSWPSWSPDGQWLGFSSDRLNGQFDIYLAKIGSNGQSTEACILPGASSATDEEFHPVWVVPVKKPWWLRLLALWPWLIPLVALLILGWLFCRKRENVLVVRTVNAISGETIEDAKIDIQPRP